MELNHRIAYTEDYDVNSWLLRSEGGPKSNLAVYIFYHRKNWELDIKPNCSVYFDVDNVQKIRRVYTKKVYVDCYDGRRVRFECFTEAKAREMRNRLEGSIETIKERYDTKRETDKS